MLLKGKELLYVLGSLLLLLFIVTSFFIFLSSESQDYLFELTRNSEYELLTSLNELQEDESIESLNNLMELKVNEKRIEYSRFNKHYIIGIEYNGGITDCEVNSRYWDAINSGDFISCMLVTNSENGVSILPYISEKTS